MFPDPPVREGSLTVYLELEKKTNLLVLDFQINGHLSMICDDCLEPFLSPVELSFRQFVKLSDGYEELDDTMVSISRNNEKINVAQWLFEAIVLNIPIRRVHPLDETGQPTCDADMIKKIKNLSHENQIEKDPRWDKLTALLN